MTNDLWPEDITSEAVVSPSRILLDQADALAIRTNNLLEARVRRRKDEDRIILGFEVVPHGVDTKVRLFEVHHRMDFEYPAAIILPKTTLPEYLRGEQYVPSTSEIMRTIVSAPKILREMEGNWVKNEWIATSPQEFIEKMTAVFASPQIKSRVLSLLARANEANDESGLIDESDDPSS